MPKIIKELSVFFPTYNEEENIENTVEKAKGILEKVAEKWEIIIVDDGSSDKTPQVADSLAVADKRIRVIHQPNSGYGGALKTGFANAKYEWVAFTDSDGQFNFGEITKFIAKKDEADLILGFRKNRADSFMRKFFTFGWSSLAKILLGLSAKDYSCGFKMIKKEVYQKVLPLVGEEKVTQIELLVKAKRMGFAFTEVGVNHYPRAGGKQTGANLKVVFKSILDLFNLWFALTNKLVFFTLLAILLIGAFLRLYKISEYMIFLGDEGRDVIVVRRLLVYGDLIFVGPGTSLGNMYLGPLYYYMMAPALLLANFSPVGPAIMVALLGVATIFLVWFVARDWFPATFKGQSLQGINIGALVAAGLYAIAPTTIAFSNFSWNPNIMPFFALLCIHSIWKVWVKQEFKWLIVLGVSYAFVLQSHYFGLFLAPVLILFWILTLRNLKLIGNFLQKSLFGLLIFAGLMFPLVLFDFKHDFRNFTAMRDFAFQNQGSFSVKPLDMLVSVPLVWQKVSTRLLAGRNESAGIVTALIIFIGVLSTYTTSIRSDVVKRRSLLLIIAWIGFGLVGLSLFRQELFDHYFGFLFPVPFILLGGLTEYRVHSTKYKIVSGIWYLVFGVLIAVNLINNPLRYPPNRQLQRSMEIASFIKEKAEDERFNIATISERNPRDVYQYFLLLWGAKVVDTDQNAVKYTITDQLFVVCELAVEKCDPIHNPSAWITNFGWSKINNHWQVAGANIYKLGHAK